MKLDEIVAWYQKKIGTYDKQQWEKTVEQKILDGFSSDRANITENVQCCQTLKTAKLKTELIDVDLVRGSTFPKAKPKQSLLTVIRFAILRYLLLPVYSKWWVNQTSPNVFAILLFLYITQMINWAVYTFNIHRLESAAAAVSAVEVSSSPANNATTTLTKESNDTGSIGGGVKQLEEHIVSLSELLIPMALSLFLSLIHSQIVATNTASGGTKTKRKRLSNSSQNEKQTLEPRVRRRKKLVRIRSQDLMDGTAAQQQQRNKPNNTIRKHLSLEVNKTANLYANVPFNHISKTATAIATEATIHTSKIFASAATSRPPSDTTTANGNPETFHTTSSILSHPYVSTAVPIKLKLDLNSATTPHPTLINSNNSDCLADHSGSSAQKKRNVNWHSPIHNYAIETQEKQQQTSPTIMTQSLPVPLTSSGSETNLPNKIIEDVASSVSHIDDCVQEFYDDLISRTLRKAPSSSSNNSLNGVAGVVGEEQEEVFVVCRRRAIGEDDGFESLNGKSSSGDEEHFSPPPLPTTAADAIALKNQLRIRLNAGDRLANSRDVESIPSTIGYRRKLLLSSESDYEKNRPASASDTYSQPKKSQLRAADASSDETDEDGDVDAEIISSPSLGNNSNYNECTTSATEWLGVTTNSEECSYTSELENSDDCKNHPLSDEDGYDLDYTPTTILNPHGITDRISCTFWDQREIKKAQMSVLEISSSIIERVESMPDTNDYIYIGIGFSFLLSFIPCFCRLCEVTIDADKPSEINYLDVPMLLWEKASFSFFTIFRFAFGYTQWERTILIIGFIQRLCLTLILFIIFAVAERTFKQRFLYGKLFSHLTSSRRARKSNLPHFRLNKVRNIKTWLSVRSYLKKRGPQRSVDIIVSAAFIVTLLLLAFLSVEWLKDSVHLHSHLNLEALMWSTTIGIFLLRFMTLGNKIHDKYRSVSVLITEQINLYLQIEQKPKKKEELMVSNSVLKLAADLLKELESPFKISGLSANPYLFTTIKVVILSALSGVLSEMLGFKLKLHKIKIK